MHTASTAADAPSAAPTSPPGLFTHQPRMPSRRTNGAGIRGFSAPLGTFGRIFISASRFDDERTGRLHLSEGFADVSLPLTATTARELARLLVDLAHDLDTYPESRAATSTPLSHETQGLAP